MIEMTPDNIVLLKSGFITLNGTIVFTWLVMAVLVVLALLTTRRLSEGPSLSRWQNLLETVITYMRNQIREITQQDPDRFLPFLGTLFLFISVSNLLHLVPGYRPPTSSLYTTAALAIVVFFAVPVFGISQHGILGYVKHYTQPTIVMLPFNIIGDLSRTLALAVRLFGNIMSSTMILAVLLSIAPLFVPIVMQVLGLLIGQIQAYIFTVLAAVYIGAATRSDEEHSRAKTTRKGVASNG